MKKEYMTKGVCARRIDFEIEDGIIKSVQFIGGCSGNTSGICRLVAGMDANDVIGRIKGTKCGPKPTSCPDQLALALEEITKA